MRAGGLLAFVACTLGALGACAATSQSQTQPRRGPVAHAAFARVQASADLDGAPLAPRLAPGRPTIFVVFASWCGPCRRELATLAELRAAHPRLRVIGLNAYEDWADSSNDAKLRAYLAESAPWLPVVRADAALLDALGGVPKIPSVFVFDGAGRLTHRFVRHERPPPTLEELATALPE